MTHYKLVENADTSHEDAREWYGSYGYHITTENHGDVCIQAVEYDWLDDNDEAVAENLAKTYPNLLEDEVEFLISKARFIRQNAEEIEECLEEAVQAYEAQNVQECVEAIEKAESLERDHGDTPASNALHSQLLEEACEIWGTVIYRDKSGVGHAWSLASDEEVPFDDKEKIAAHILNEGFTTCDSFFVNDRHYSW